jgi:PAS domain S-box-containing protein
MPLEPSYDLEHAAFQVSTKSAKDPNLAEEALRECEEKYRMLLDEVRDYAIFMLDPQGVVVSWNAGAERIKDYRGEHIIGHNFSCFFPPEDIKQGRPEEVLRMATANGRHEYQGMRVRKDGSRFLASIIFIALRDQAGNLRGFSETSRDLSERKESGDLQEPLRMVASYTQLLAQRYKGRLDSDADEFIAYAVDGSNRMQGLIKDLLTYSRAGANGKVLHEISSENALKDALTNLRATIEESSAVITHDLLPAITMDETQLVQLFQNLVWNAIKYRSAEVPHVHVSARKNGGDEWIFSVRDNGLGTTHNTLTGSSSFSSGCTGQKSSTAPGSDWQFARKCSNVLAGESGSSRKSKRAQPSSLPCLNGMENDGIRDRINSIRLWTSIYI